MFKPITILHAALLLLLSPVLQAQNMQLITSTEFIFPMGYHDGLTYGPRINYDNSLLIENTDFDVQNPDLKGFSACFEAAKSQLHHGGEDLYRMDGQSTAFAEVVAIADGIVIEYNPSFEYPGKAVVIEHTLPSGEEVYSVYMHLRDVQVTEGQQVYRGQTIGFVLYQLYDGNFLEFHAQHYNSDDSHLHFEIRYFADANQVYLTYNNGQYASCARGDKAGRGYTPPDVHAYNFPSPGQGYTDPTDFINSHQATPTPTPTFTTTPTLTPLPGGRGFYPNGIMASYYNDQDDRRWYIGGPITWPTFTNFVVSRLESLIAFNTGTSSPAPGVNGTFWSARWIGQLAIPQSENYVFYFDDLDDGARLYLDGNLVLESWLVQGAHDYQTEPIFLDAGLHDIVVEYAQGPAVGGGFYLSWSSPFFAKELIGPASGHPPTPTPTPTPSCPCIFTCGPSARSLALRSNVGATPTPSVLRALSQAIDLVELLYRLRDEVLAQTPEGQHYIATYYAHSPEIAAILLSDSALYEQGFAVIDSFVPVLQALVDGKGEGVVITAQQVEAVQDFLNALLAQSSPALAETIHAEQARRPLERVIGMNAAEAWAYLNGYHLTWRPPLSTANPYIAQRGRTIPVEFSLTDFQGNFVVDESVTLQLLDGAGNIVIGPIGLGNTPVKGIVVQGKKYHYDLQTTDLTPGLYTLQVFYNTAVPGEPAVWAIQIKVK